MKYRVKRHTVTQPLDKPYRFIPLTQNQNAIVDAADFEWLSQWNWVANWNPLAQCFYAMRTAPNHLFIAMHRQILGCTKSEEADHRNHNTLDNRRKNIRKCSPSQNQANRRIQRNNTSGFCGVSWNKRNSKWRVRVVVNRKEIHVGTFNSAEEGGHAYDIAATKYFGPFAHLNFPH
jgi:hypothetical protein